MICFISIFAWENAPFFRFWGHFTYITLYDRFHYTKFLSKIQCFFGCILKFCILNKFFLVILCKYYKGNFAIFTNFSSSAQAPKTSLCAIWYIRYALKFAITRCCGSSRTPKRLQKVCRQRNRLPHRRSRWSYMHFYGVQPFTVSPALTMASTSAAEASFAGFWQRYSTT